MYRSKPWLAFLAFVCALLLPSAAHAQFLGYVANQTVQASVFTNADCSVTLTSSPLQNIGQVGHALFYSVTSPGPNLIVAIQGSADGSTYFQISNNAPVQPGIIAAVGSYPFIRAEVTGGGAGCRITANYSGSSVATTINLTGSNAQFMYLFNPFINAAAGTTANSDNLSPPYGNSAGYFVFSYAGGAGPAGSTLALKAIDGPTGTTYTIATFNLATTAATAQIFPIPGYSANNLFVTYTAGGASANAFTLSYYYTYPGQGPVSPNQTPIPVVFSNADPCQNSSAAKSSAAISSDTTGTAQLIAGVGGKIIYPCAVSIVADLGTNSTLQIVAGTGASCTSPVNLTGNYKSFNTGTIQDLIQISGLTAWSVPTGDSICAVLAGGTQYALNGFITYVQQ
jgi:hypothetical protein